MRVLMACLACLVLSMANAAKAQDVTTLLSPSKPKAPEAITLADIPGRADADERYAEEVSLRAARADPLGRLVPRLATIEKSVSVRAASAARCTDGACVKARAIPEIVTARVYCAPPTPALPRRAALRRQAGDDAVRASGALPRMSV